VDPSSERLHRLRIRGKALRYMAEALREAGGEPAETAAALESGLKKLQDALGAVQDATMVVSRLDGLGLAGTLPAPAVGPARVAAARELERRRAAFLTELDAGEYQNLLHEVKKVSAKQGDGAGGEPRDDRVPLEEIPGIGPAKARRLADAGLASPDALRSASLEELASVKTIGPHQARLIKEFVEESTNGTSGGAEESEPDGKRFERAQAVLALSATVSDYARTLAEELAAQAEGDAVRAGRQAERLADQLAEMSDRVDGISTKRLKSLRAELRETEGLLAKVLDVDSSSLKMNKLRKALKAHRKAVEGYIGG
jgi:CHAD domain-containing protein